MTAGFHLPLLLLSAVILRLLTSVKCEDEELVDTWVIHHSTDCSATCGIGIKTQTLCLHRKVSIAINPTETDSKGEAPTDCFDRRVKCQASWQCGLRTTTMFAGEKMQMECLGEVMKSVAIFTSRVNWHFARGVITIDDSLFAHLLLPNVDPMILDPITEEDAGTYCCRVRSSQHVVKEIYWGVRVLPKGVFDLDYESSKPEWETLQNQTVTVQFEDDMDLVHSVLLSLGVAGVFAGIILLSLHWILLRRKTTVV